MARILLVTSPEKGHLNPVVGVAQHLKGMGHHVGWLCLPEPSPQLEKLGVELVKVGHSSSPHELVTSGEALAKLVRDEEKLRAWIRTLLLDNVLAQVEPVREALRAFKPHAAGTDGMQYAAVIACELEKIPYAGVSSALTLFEPEGLDHPLIRTVRGLRTDREKLFARYGLHPEFRTCEAISPRKNVIFATRALVGDALLPPNTELVGPSIPPHARGDEASFPWERLPHDRPVVYASFGSQICWQPELFDVIAKATAALDVTLVASMGELLDSAFAKTLPPHVVAVRYAPQRQLLMKTSAFITHGGANSVMEAMTAGVPLLLLPICNDQPVQAHFVTRAGVGIAKESTKLTVEECRAAVKALLDEGTPYRRAARRVRDDYAKHDGAKRAATIIASLA